MKSCHILEKTVVRFLLWQSQIGKSIEVQCGIDHLGGEMKTVAVEVVLVLDDVEFYPSCNHTSSFTLKTPSLNSRGKNTRASTQGLFETSLQRKMLGREIVCGQFPHKRPWYDTGHEWMNFSTAYEKMAF